MNEIWIGRVAADQIGPSNRKRSRAGTAPNRSACLQRENSPVRIIPCASLPIKATTTARVRNASGLRTARSTAPVSSRSQSTGE